MRIKLGSKARPGNFDFEAMRCLGIASTGGSGVGECLAAVQRIRRNDTESWVREFGALADRLADEADTAIRGHDPVSAAERLCRAATYYRTATFYTAAKDPRLRHFQERSRNAFHRALGCTPTDTEIISIPFEGASLPGYFVSAGPGPNPTLLVLGGYDSTAEELMLWLGNACGRRGWNALVFEGPGQPNARQLNPGLVFRPDYEAPVTAVVDYALSRTDVDPSRLAIIGYSFGGYLAPRAAAHEPRIRAVAANTIGVDIAAAIRLSIPSLFWRMPEGIANAAYRGFASVNVTARFFFESGQEAFGASTPTEFLRSWEAYNLWSVRDRLDVPLLVLLTEDEIAEARKPLIQDTFRFLQGLAAPVSLRVFPRAEGATAHCQLDSPERMPPVLFQWLNQVFDERMPSRDGARADAEGFEQASLLVRRHHGAETARLVTDLAARRAAAADRHA